MLSTGFRIICLSHPNVFWTVYIRTLSLPLSQPLSLTLSHPNVFWMARMPARVTPKLLLQNRMMFLNRHIEQSVALSQLSLATVIPHWHARAGTPDLFVFRADPLCNFTSFRLPDNAILTAKRPRKQMNFSIKAPRGPHYPHEAHQRSRPESVCFFFLKDTGSCRSEGRAVRQIPIVFRVLNIGFAHIAELVEHCRC